jgi:hypothetical protein
MTTTAPHRYRFRVEAWEDNEYVVTMDGSPLTFTMTRSEAEKIAGVLNMIDRNYTLTITERP